ncbi:SDR family oxidoreductase [Nitriliruptoraceae bacterium ZYF776]|nr:SDR family oxidoreductase [Profundirhabdus halotolerans]
MPARITRALLTGASAGLGAHFARQLAARGVDLVLVARRADRLDALAQELPVDVEVVAADLTDPADRARVTARLTATQRPVDLLVNNAGAGVYGAFAELDPDRQLDVVTLNVTALTELARAVAPQLVARGRGGILNVGSTAGYQPDPFGTVYGATKAYVRSFSEALHEELRPQGVHVMLLAPGFTETEFQQVAGVAGDPLPSAARMRPEVVVAAALRDFARGRAVCVPGGINRLTAVVSDASPSAISRRVSGALHRRFHT